MCVMMYSNMHSVPKSVFTTTSATTPFFLVHSYVLLISLGSKYHLFRLGPGRIELGQKYADVYVPGP